MKLTLITISAKGYEISRFCYAWIINGKSVVPFWVVREILDELGVERGDTWSLG